MGSDVPEGWRSTTLGKLFDWASGRRPDFALSGSGPMPVFGSNGVLGRASFHNVERAFLIGRVGASGSLQVVKERAWAGDNTLIATPAQSNSHFDFLGYLLSALDLPSYATKTAQPLLTKSRLGPVRVALPSPVEQEKIAAILSAVDDAIRATQAVIDRTRRVKEGLLQDLLTRGVGPDGKPHADLKQPPVWIEGRLPEVNQIPTSWELVRLCDVARLESGHTPSRRIPEYWHGDVQWLSLHDTKRMVRHVITETAMTITAAGIANSSARLLPPGTVALSRTASIGKCVILGREMATSQDFACYVPGPFLSSRYLLQLFRYMQHVWSALSSGSTHQTVYMPTFERLQILLPPRDEQDRIADAVEPFDVATWRLDDQLGQLETLKSGLLQDLLTGRVRVTP